MLYYIFEVGNAGVGFVYLLLGSITKFFYEQIITVLNIILGYCLNFMLDILLDYLGLACTDLAMFQLALGRIKGQKVCIS